MHIGIYMYVYVYIYTFIRIHSSTYIHTYTNTYRPYESLLLHAILVHVVTESGEEPYCQDCLLKIRDILGSLPINNTLQYFGTPCYHIVSGNSPIFIRLFSKKGPILSGATNYFGSSITNRLYNRIHNISGRVVIVS